MDKHRNDYKNNKIVCSQCDKEVPSTFKHCPHCGVKISKRNKLTNGDYIFFLLVIVLIVGFIGFMWKPYIRYLCINEDEKYALKYLRHERSTLLFPESMRIYEVRVEKVDGYNANLYVYYIAANKGGGYTESEFIFNEDMNTFIEKEEDLTIRLEENPLKQVQYLISNLEIINFKTRLNIFLELTKKGEKYKDDEGREITFVKLDNEKLMKYLE